ncbi:MAG: DUF4382 domain-containing protein [Chitinophagaceae bacterium]
MRHVLYLLSLVTLITSACTRNERENTEDKARVQIRLTDDPADYEEVWVDIRDVQVNVTGSPDEGWESLSGVRAGSYDLLRLINDQDTLLVDAFIPEGRLHQIRLILGSENYIKVNGEMIPLTTPSAQQSGLKINVQQDVVAGLMYTILLDFDVARSIVETGNNKFILKPVIRGTLNAAGGSIKGVVVPGSFPTTVFAVQGADTITSSFTDNAGGYCLRGLPAGGYTVSFVPGDPGYRDTSIAPIAVLTGAVTNVDTMFLQP